MQLRAGDRIDHYTLVKPLGEGGQGSVWKAIDPRDGGVVRALKLVEVDNRGGQSFDRMRREAKILAASQHPALVGCHGFFEDMRAGLVGMVMDLVPGVSLAAAVAQKRLDNDHCFAVLEQLASALAYVHGSGLVHRDIKPDNVVLAESFWTTPRHPGAVKLVDFGIAVLAGNPWPLTSEGAVVGTIPYMAPELIDPATWGRAEGPARDIFAFGVLAWEILFDRHPTGLAPDASMIDYARAYKAAHAGRIIVWPPRGLDGAWGAAVGASLALRPADRAADGAALLAILRTGSDPHRALGLRTSSPSVSTLPHRRSTHPTTTPMARSGPEEELPEAPTAKRGGGWALAVLLFIVAMVAGAAASIASGIFESSHAPPPEPTSTLAPSAPPLVSVPTKPATTASSSQEPSACCPRGVLCNLKSGGTKYSCPPCKSTAPQLPRNYTWRLRVTGVVDDSGQDVIQTHRSSKLCMQLGDVQTCLTFKSIISQDFQEDDRLLVTTEDVEDGKVYVAIDEGESTRGLVYGTPVLSSALCQGLFLHLGSSGDKPWKIAVYLDPMSDR